MIPARPIGRSRSAMTSILLVELALDVIDRHQSFPRARPADDDLASGDRVGVIGMHRLPELVHHVVRDVHHRADRPHPGRDQPALHPVRRRSVRHALEPARREPWIEIGFLDADADVAGHVVIGLVDGGLGEAQGGSGEGRDLARETDHAQRIAAVRLDVDVDDRLADQVGERRAEGDLVAVAEDVDAVAIGPEAELDRAAQHPVADLAADLRALDSAVAGQDGPDERGRHELVRLEVLGTAHDLELAAGLADVDACQPQGVRVRMPAGPRGRGRRRHRSSRPRRSRWSRPPSRASSAPPRGGAATGRRRRTRAARKAERASSVARRELRAEAPVRAEEEPDVTDAVP